MVDFLVRVGNDCVDARKQLHSWLSLLLMVVAFSFRWGRSQKKAIEEGANSQGFTLIKGPPGDD